jgi:glycine/D-amino acid oxidase-like deaminating enzyme
VSVVLDIDVIVVGGGVAGLWLLDELIRAGYRAVLLEYDKLGSGQTISAQGIIHSGLKYTLDGLLNESAEAIRDMPEVWRSCLSGEREPRLGRDVVRSDFCYLWRSDSLMSRIGMMGARAGLRVKPIKLSTSEVPSVLAGCPGEVFRLDEQVIEPGVALAALAALHPSALLRVGAIEWTLDGAGQVRAARVRARDGHDGVELRPRAVVLTAGAGNAELRRQLGLDEALMQRRPLHMIMARGPLPLLQGHCTDGAKTRVTITSAHDRAGRVVWQIGGQVAEDGVRMTAQALIAHTRRELLAVIPGLSLDGVQWSTYAVDRAEALTPDGKRPTTAWCLREGNVITGWPTKLALAPVLASQIRAELAPPSTTQQQAMPALDGWPRPEVAPPPWEVERTWLDDR